MGSRYSMLIGWVSNKEILEADNVKEQMKRESETTKQFEAVNKRMEQLETIFEVLTNDSRLKDIIEEINKNQNNINNKNVSLQQQESEPEDSGCIRESTTSENEI